MKNLFLLKKVKCFLFLILIITVILIKAVFADITNTANHVVISAIMIDSIAGVGGTLDDVVELYNPTSSDIDLSTYSIQLEKDNTFPPDYKKNLTGTIPAYGFYLIVDTEANALLLSLADITAGWAMTDNDSVYLVNDQVNITNQYDVNIIDFVGYGTSPFYEGSNSAVNPPDGGCIERKALSNSTSSSLVLGGNHETWGNGDDIDDNLNDLVSQMEQNFQNSLSPKEWIGGEEEVLTIIKYNVENNRNIKENDNNIPIIAFQVQDNNAGHTLNLVKVENVNGIPMQNSSEIASMKLYIDSDTNHAYTIGETLAATLIWDGGQQCYKASNIGVNIYNNGKGTNFVVCIDIVNNPIPGTYFEAKIPANGIMCSGGGKTGNIKNDTLQKIYMAPSVVIAKLDDAHFWDGTHEWITLYNVTSNTINITGWYIENKNAVQSDIFSGSIPAYGFFLVGYTGMTNSNGNAADANWSSSTFLANSDSGVKLVNNLGHIIDAFGYGDSPAGYYETGAIGNSSTYMYERKANASSTGGAASSMHIGDIDEFNGNAYDTDNNNNDFVTVGNPAFGNVIPQGTSSPPETNGIWTPPPEIIITKSDVQNSTNYPSNANVTVLAFKLTNTGNTNIKTIKITTMGNISSYLTAVKLYYDNNNDKKYDGGDTLIQSGGFSGGKWVFDNLSVINGRNLIATFDVPSNIPHNRYFRGAININDVIGFDNSRNDNSAITNNGVQYILRIAPTIQVVSTNIDNGTDSVTNNGNTFDLIATVIENSNSGRVVFADLSDLNKSSFTNMSNTGGNDFAISNFIVDGAVPVGNRQIVILAYDSTTNITLVTKKTTYINVIGNTPPEITSAVVDRSTYYKLAGGIFPNSSVTFTVQARDLQGTIPANTKVRGVWIDLSAISGSNHQQLSLVSGTSDNGTWQYAYPIPLTVTNGSFSLQTVASDKDWGFDTEFISFTISTNHNIPVADAGTNQKIGTSQLVELSGSGTAYNGAIIESHIWSIVSNTTGASIKLSSENKQNISFTAPQEIGTIVLSLKVADSYQYESIKDFIAIKVNIGYAPNLENAHPYNTVIKPGDNEIRFMNLSKGTVITLYTITGDKVVEIPNQNDSTITWTILDYVAAGVYIVYMKDEAGHIKKSKIIIVR